MKQIIIFFTTFVILFCNPNTVYAEVHKNDPIMDSYAIDLQEQHFLFDEVGKLVGGVTRGVGEPIDYSSLLKEVYLRSGFELSLLGCSDCNKRTRKFSTKNLTLIEDYEESFFLNQKLDDIRKIRQASLDALGFNVEVVTQPIRAKIVVVLGSKNYLLKKMSKNSDKIAIEEIEHWYKTLAEQRFLSLMKLDNSVIPFCHVSEIKWAANKQIYIYLNTSGIDDCLSQSFLAAIGLKPTPLNIPSISDNRKKYRIATFTDFLYIRLLYHSQFPSSGNSEDIIKFWGEHAKSIWYELTKEDIYN